ncbi:MAG TPA: hypothetical protein VLE22_09320, partial [Bryobacteraceae bacterium]|nr:hypothetical protein [Bryobacteraceae bacterium]
RIPMHGVALQCHFRPLIQEIAELADEKLYQAENLGSGTFRITKPKRKSRKSRQSKLKNPQRGARK